MEHMRVREYGSEFDWGANIRYITPNAQPPLIKDALLVRSGRDALFAIAQKHRDEYRRVLLPALCCTAMVTPFMKNGYELVFYQMTDDLAPDVYDIRNKLAGKTLLVYMDFFGAPSLTTEQMVWIRGFGDVLFIQDRTHDLLTGGQVESISDFKVASIRKWMALADGGLLHASVGDLDKSVRDEDSRFSNMRASALEHKRIYLQTGNLGMKERFRAEFRWANEILEEADECRTMSTTTQNLLSHIDLSAILRQRLSNVKALRELLSGIPEIQDAVPCPERSALYYPVLVSNRDKVQSMMAGLGVYCPVIWPIPEPARGICKMAQKISEYMLALPCDQRYSPEDMEFICGALQQSMEELVG